MKKLILAAICIGLSANVIAADNNMNAPSEPSFEAATTPAADAATDDTNSTVGQGLFFGAEGGYVMTSGNFSDAANNSEKINSGYGLGVHAGYALTTSLRIQADVNYRHNKSKQSNTTVDLWTYVASAYYDINTASGYAPFIGAGVGFDSGKNIKTHMVYQGTAGLGYNVDNTMKVYIDYTLLGFSETGSGLYHSFNLGLNYYF